MRRNFQPTRRTAQQVKADEDFALRMQRQEREIAAHQVAYYQEMQRRQQSLEDMGGVPQQPIQVCHSHPSSSACHCKVKAASVHGLAEFQRGMSVAWQACAEELLTDFVQRRN